MLLGFNRDVLFNIGSSFSVTKVMEYVIDMGIGFRLCILVLGMLSSAWSPKSLQLLEPAISLSVFPPNLRKPRKDHSDQDIDSL